MSVYTNRLETVRTGYDFAHIYASYAGTFLGYWWGLVPHDPANSNLNDCISYIISALYALSEHDVTFPSKYALIMMLDPAEYWWIATELPPTAPTMQQIINAMFTAKPAQISSFVGLTDAYKQSIWNAPFNAEMWAAIARGFQQWP